MEKKDLSLYRRYLMLEACFGETPFTREDVQVSCEKAVSIRMLERLSTIGLLDVRHMEKTRYYVVNMGI